MCWEDLIHHGLVVEELEDGNVSIRGSAGEKAARLVRSPGESVDGGGVQSNVMDALPLPWAVLTVDVDVAGVGGGGEDGAKLRVGPGDGPDGSFMAVIVIMSWCFSSCVRSHMLEL